MPTAISAESTSMSPHHVGSSHPREQPAPNAMGVVGARQTVMIHWPPCSLQGAAVERSRADKGHNRTAPGNALTPSGSLKSASIQSDRRRRGGGISEARALQRTRDKLLGLSKARRGHFHGY
jgi:hypothetical protein